MPYRNYLLLLTLLSCVEQPNHPPERTAVPPRNVQAVNEGSLRQGDRLLAITGARIIDGHGGSAIENGYVLVKGSYIEAVGTVEDMSLPEGAEVIEGAGMTVLPGLIDAHFHLDGLEKLPHVFLQNGITSVRDPGAWIEAYEGERAAGYTLPRLFLTGPHLDGYPPAYPKNSYIVQDRAEARAYVAQLARQGASAIKVYFRLSLGLIEEVCRTAHDFGMPVTAHLEITDAREAILAGLDGIEHITSFGPHLLPGPRAEQYRQAVLGDNDARREGRYAMWSELKLEQPKVDDLIALLVEKKTFVCPTLGAFEYRIGAEKRDSTKLRAFDQMLSFTGKAHRAGVRLVVGSHSAVPYAEWGWAYHHEMELLAESGMSNTAVIEAATMQNARFFCIDDRLGSIEPGKLADLILVEGNPLEDLAVMRRVKKVMLNGHWVK